MYRLLLCLILLALISCTLPTEDISDRYIFTQTQVRNAIEGEIRIRKTLITLDDNRYLGYTQEEFYEILAGFESTRDIRRIPEYRDCNRFAKFLSGNIALLYPGIIFGTIKYQVQGHSVPHLANIFLDTHLDVYILDYFRTGSILWDVDPFAVYYRVEI